MVDILAVFATLFGLATSLGYGAEQSAAGIGHLFGFTSTNLTKIIVILAITAMALVSVWRGLDGGIKLLSEGNMLAAAVLGIFILFCGPVIDTLISVVDNTISYLAWLPQK